jgi:exopolyphosphatase / guanosine-5'-triphosphate,3'-diphosphate pyrophosphatase
MLRYAAVDIGSNSARLQVAETHQDGAIEALASERQVTRLGESVFRTGRISAEALDFISGVLAQFAQIYRKFEVVGVRAVATAAVRDASNQREFLDRASHALGAPIEIISGQEEARLVHLGVQTVWPHPKQSILLIDIGGGSAEIVHSQAARIKQSFSKPLGAVRLTDVFLKSDPPTPRELHRLNEYIEERIASPVSRIGRQNWDRAIATSATAAAVVSAVNHLPRAQRDDCDRMRASTAQIRKLFQRLSLMDLGERRKVAGIGVRRAEIILAGAAVLLRILEDFQMPSVYYSKAGVRDGIVADLAARSVGHELTQLDLEQRRVVEQMAAHFNVPLKHARKVARLAHSLFLGLRALHNLPPNTGKLLEAAAYLHDTGHYVSDTRHHKHSYYLVANSDMPGFTDRERELIANLCRYHRKALPVPMHPNFQNLAPEEKRTVMLLTPLLRLADGLDRSQEQRVDSVRCVVRNGDVLLQIEADGDIDLEQWAAERAAEVFSGVYEKGLALSRVKPG